MPHDGTARIAAYIFAGIVLMFLGLACLYPVAVPSDPVEGGEQALNNVRLAAIALSTLFGSAGMMMFIRAAYLLSGKGVASRRSAVAIGVVVIVVAIFLVAIGAGHRSAIAPWLLFFGFLLWYVGGGFLMLSVTRLPCPRAEPER